MEEDWGQVITDTNLRSSGEATPTVILITDGVGEENLGMVTIFCHQDQSKMEASHALSALHQHNSPESSVVVIRRYTNTPYIPQKTSWLLYLNVSTLFGGASSIQFPLDHLCIQRLLPYSKTKVLLPCEEGETRFKVYPHTREVLRKSSEEGHWFSDPVLLSIPSSALLLHPEATTQTGEELGYNPALLHLQDFHQARSQLECKQSGAAQKLAYKYDNHWAKLVITHQQKWSKMAQQGNTAFQEIFAMASPAESIKLLSWCISSVVPFHYISEALAVTTQLGENAPATTVAPEWENHPLWAPQAV